MEMEVMVPVPIMDFDFNSARSSPHTSAPSTPRRLGDYFFSAPTSPGGLTDFYREFDEFLLTKSRGSSVAQVPFDWEEKPGTPKANINSKYEDDFAFDVSGELDRNSVSAEELFDGGVIKPLKPPPRLQLPTTGGGLSPRSHRSSSPLSQGKRIIRGAFSPREKKDYNPFENNRKGTPPERERGRERVSSLSSSSRRGTRSLSPLRSPPHHPWEQEEQQTKQSTMSSKPPLASTTSALSKGGYRKWRLKDFFLFRSASDGRAMDKDPLKKYSPFFRKHEDFRTSSLRAIESPGSGSNSRRRGPVSAHELHYKVNRAVSEDMKKKTFLPYKQGILGRLAFNPAVHALANGFGVSRK